MDKSQLKAMCEEGLELLGKEGGPEPASFWDSVSKMMVLDSWLWNNVELHSGSLVCLLQGNRSFILFL